MKLLFALLLLGRWLLVSDLHVEPRPILPRPLHLGHDSDWALFDSTVAQMRTVDPNTPVVIVSGDFLAHQFPNDVPLAEHTMTRIVHTFNAAFPRAQFVIVPGNNDDPCGDYRATPGTPYFSYIAHVWAPLVNRNGAAPHFERDFATYGWYSARLPGKAVRAIALDSVYWSSFYSRCSNVHPNAPQRELGWLAQSLAAMPRGARSIVVMHIPPGADAASTVAAHRLFVVSFLQPSADALLISELGRHASRVAFVIAGHLHRNDFRVFENVPILVAASMAPTYYNNPTFLQLDVDAAGTLRDYTPFHYDFDSRTWQNGDTFDRTYGVSAFSGSALASIHARLASDEDIRTRWARLSVSESRYADITLHTWRVFWCAQAQIGDGFSNCAGVQRRVRILVLAAVLAGVGLTGLLALAVARARHRRTV